MSDAERQLLGQLSNSARNSTIKRLKRVAEGAENWAIAEGKLSFADLARHILDCDKAILKIFESNSIGKNLGEPGVAGTVDREGFEALLVELKEYKTIRHDFIVGLSDDDLNVLIDADRIRGVEKMPTRLLLVETLDHEIHHRGQIAVYLGVYESMHGAQVRP